MGIELYTFFHISKWVYLMLFPLSFSRLIRAKRYVNQFCENIKYRIFQYFYQVLSICVSLGFIVVLLDLIWTANSQDHLITICNLIIKPYINNGN